MELATPPPAARAPVAWYGWWLMPLALGAGTVVTAVAGPDQVQIPATFAGTAVTVAGAVCVRLLVRTRSQLRRADAAFRSAQTEHSQQRYADVQGREQRFAAERADLEAQLGRQATTFDARLAEQTQAYEAALADRDRTAQERLELQQAAVVRLGDSYLPEAVQRLREGEAIDDVLAEAPGRTTRVLSCAPHCAGSCGPRCWVSRRS